MVDLHSILATHKNKDEDSKLAVQTDAPSAELSEIPDVFFDSVLVEYKLSRLEILVLMYLYRKVWCRPNLYKQHGISQLLSLTDMVKQVDVRIEDVHQALRKLENFGFITTIRVGQYFVRRYFTKELDNFFAQTYDEFDI
jgi:DNA-binding MarR family transcriptional regulator